MSVDQTVMASLSCVWSQEKKVLGEKRVTRSFQYDTPGDLVMTYLSEVLPLQGLGLIVCGI